MSDIHHRDDDDARADAAPPTDAVSDEVKSEAAAAENAAPDEGRDA